MMPAWKWGNGEKDFCGFADLRRLPVITRIKRQRMRCYREVRVVSGEEFAWVNSGDRAYVADGELYVTGRVKDIIIKGGRNLYPHEMEDLAARVEGIRKGCIVAFGIKDQASGTEKMVVVAESREGNAQRRLRAGGTGDGRSVARIGVAAGSRGTDSAGQHSEDVQRKIAAGRDEAALSCGKTVQRQSAGMAADRETGCWRTLQARRGDGFLAA